MSRAALRWAALASALGTVTGCASVARAPAPKQLQPRQIIVGIAAAARGGAGAVKQALASEYGLTEMGSFPLGSIGLECVVFQVAPDGSIPALVTRLASDPRVALAEENQVFRGEAAEAAEPANSLAYAPALIRADAAQRTRTGKGVRVAVIDTGVAWSHPALRGRVTTVKSFVDDGERTFERDRHGTAVAGVIVASGGSERVRGIAPDAEILAIKACWYARPEAGRATCSSWTLAKAVDFAIGAGAQIVNMSLSGPSDELLARLVRRAHERGIVTVAAAAEDGDAPGFPASLPGVLAVLASDDRGRVPAVAWTLPAPVLAAPGLDILTTAPSDGWDFFSGSSLAAAHVTGVVALLREQSPSLGAAEARDALARTMRPPAGGDSTHGIGIVDACAALALLMGAASCP